MESLPAVLITLLSTTLALLPMQKQLLLQSIKPASTTPAPSCIANKISFVNWKPLPSFSAARFMRLLDRGGLCLSSAYGLD